MTTEPYGKKNPFPATVLGVKKLTGEGSPKETIHIEFDLTGSGLEYVTGDALGVLPTNDPQLVDDLIAKLGLSADQTVESPEGGSVTLRDALINSFDITGLSKPILTKWAAVSGNPDLQALVDSGDKDKISDYCWGRDLLDLATDYPAQLSDASALTSILKKIAPRLYSIASSPNAHPGQVHLCVGAVRYTTNDRRRGGVCSTFMADRLQPGDKARVFVHSNKNFRLPEDSSKPVIMVGPGTGIAPFHAFLEERHASKATGKNWFFFGNPYKATDFCYEEELTALVEAGELKLSVAWSRDQAQKVYVQHLMEQEGETLWQWLQEGAFFYVCGDASRMAKDVDAALVKVAEKFGNMSTEDATAYIADLRKEKRYQRDVY